MNLLEEYKNWYQRTFVKFEIVKCCANKEIALLGHSKDLFPFLEQGGFQKNGIAIRNINAAYLDFLEKQFIRYDFYNRCYRLYNSLATFQQGKYPMFSFSVAERKEQQKKFVQDFTARPQDFLAGYDFFLELDEKDEVKGFEQAKKVKEEFDRFSLPYSINPSGGKLGGFHFSINYSHFKEFFTPLEMIKFSFIISKEFKDLFAIESIDTTIFDARRIKKLSYSLVFGANHQWNVCLPLSDEQFENFSLNMISSPSKVLNMIKLKERGILERKGSAAGIKEFIDEYYTPAIESGEYKAIKDRRIMGTK